MKEINLIAAVASNNVIGANNGIPWHSPQDLQFFKNTTTGHQLIMGYNTFMSIGRPLPNRRTIVVTSDVKKGMALMDKWRGHPVLFATSPDMALANAQSQEGDIFVAGGAQIYEQLMPVADRLFITSVVSSPEGDVVFPSFDVKEWVVVSERYVTTPPEEPDLIFYVMERLEAVKAKIKHARGVVEG